MSNNRVFSFDGDFVRQAEFIPIENLAEVKARLTSFGAIDIKDGGKESPTSDKVVWLEFVKLNNVSTSGDIVKNDQILNNFSQAVYSIGVKNALLLVDLDTRKVVDCSNILEVYEYFRNW